MTAPLQSVRQMRLDPGARGHRAPPAGWERVLAPIARKRALELYEFTARVEHPRG